MCVCVCVCVSVTRHKTQVVILAERQGGGSAGCDAQGRVTDLRRVGGGGGQQPTRSPGCVARVKIYMVVVAVLGHVMIECTLLVSAVLREAEYADGVRRSTLH
eukprot:COSAG01_NODE_1480_length_10161_cov_32.805804_9_plen_103_part_00